MKRKNIIFVSLLILFGFSAMQSCTKVDNTTYKSDVIYAVPTAKAPIARADGTIFVPDSAINIEWTTTNTVSGLTWDVYFGTSKQPPLVKSGLADTKYPVLVTGGIKYFWRVETTDAQGVVTSSPVFNFIAITGHNPKLTINMDCQTDILAQMGLDYTADKAVDLKLLVFKKSDKSLVATIDDGLANEVWRGMKDLPDDEYILGMGFYATLITGNIKKTLTLDLTLKFVQQGIIDTTLEFPGVVNDVNTCSNFKVYLADVKKVGAKYTITKDVKQIYGTTQVPNGLVGNWLGTDSDLGYTSKIVGTLQSGKLMLDHFSAGTDGWMWDWWGEVITESYPVAVAFNYCAGTLSIASQKAIQTTYLGDVQTPYFVKTVATSVATSTFSTAGAYPVMSIKYTLVQGTTDIALYIWTNYGWPTKYFLADLTLDPAGLKVISQPIGQSEMIKRAIRELKQKKH
jgi:hypothetical protein